MPERDKFPKKYFEGNPYEGIEPEDAYRRLRWGIEPQEIFEIHSPEPLITLGDIAKIFTPNGVAKFAEYEAPFLALGTLTNILYFIPKVGGRPVHVPKHPLKFVCVVTRIDYYSDKGGEAAYYYHDHEPPYPWLYQQPSTGVCILKPSTCEDGSRSYAVGDEGVIG